jgi:site-specific recombinase XerD
MIQVQTESIKECPGYESLASCPFYLTNDFQLLEAPSLWALGVSLRSSKSPETLKQYTSTLARFLQWLDELHFGATNWLMVEDKAIDSYIVFLFNPKVGRERPENSSVEAYIAIIGGFYRWAKDNGYPVKWQMKRLVVKYRVRVIGLGGFVTVTSTGNERRLSRGVHKSVEKEKYRLFNDRLLLEIIPLFDDKVYGVIAFTMRNTGLRPMDVLQLPYKGGGHNEGLRDYRPEALAALPADLPFNFRSKGKYRDVYVPGKLWEYICKDWMPERVIRGNRYLEQHGSAPSIKHLFLKEDGTPVTYRNLWDAFEALRNHPRKPAGLMRCNPYMLRHSFATYFVYNALKAKDLLGKGYIYNIQIDEALRRYMGHQRSATSYKYYVHLAGFLSAEDVMGPLVDVEVNLLLPLPADCDAGANI